jgi:hypothetical protein
MVTRPMEDQAKTLYRPRPPLHYPASLYCVHPRSNEVPIPLVIDCSVICWACLGCYVVYQAMMTWTSRS